MQTTFEQAVEIVNSLPPSDLQKLSEIIREKQIQQAKKAEKEKEVAEEVGKFNLAMKWIAEHRQEYLNQWVCLDGDRLISYGEDSERVYEEALKHGIKAPFLEFVKEEEAHYMGGWEACR